MYRRAVVRQTQSASAFYAARLQTRGVFKSLSNLAENSTGSIGNPKLSNDEISENNAQPPMASASPPLDIAPLPQAPAPVSGYPTPWVAQEDVEEYILPLYRRGWGIEFRRPSGQDKRNRSAEPIACLVVYYGFSKYDDAISFLNEVVGIAGSENHHPSITVTNGKIPKITVITQTDSAIRPAWEAEETRAARKMSGLTRRDLRLAVLVDNLYDAYVSDGRGVDVKRRQRPPNRRPNWDRLLKSFKKSILSKPSSKPPASPEKPQASNSKPKRRCPACGEFHDITECPKRRDIRPSAPCMYCQGDHWMVDCPNRKRSKSRLRRNCETCGKNHPSEACPESIPPSPCPNCGGNHWNIDCREPRAPLEAVAKLTLPIPQTLLRSN